MANRGLFTFLIVLMGLGILFAGGMNVGYETAVDDFDVTNESITVDYTDPVPVDERGTAYTYNETVQVYNSSDALLVEGTDYNWLASNGTVEWLDTANTTSGETASISYDYTAPPEENEAAFGIIEIVGTGLVFLLILLIGQWVFDVVGDW